MGKIVRNINVCSYIFFGACTAEECQVAGVDFRAQHHVIYSFIFTIISLLQSSGNRDKFI